MNSNRTYCIYITISVQYKESTQKNVNSRAIKYNE